MCHLSATRVCAGAAAGAGAGLSSDTWIGIMRSTDTPLLDGNHYNTIFSALRNVRTDRRAFEISLARAEMPQAAARAPISTTFQ